MIAQWAMSHDRATPLLGGLSPAQFMRRHWQRKPLLVRGAATGAMPGFDRRRLFELASRDAVESRLVTRDAANRWLKREGPLPRRALPPLATSGWSVLVQGVDLHDDAAHDLLSRFRFVPDARLDDVMVSFASDGGGVGPHIDSYDVFLLQLAGKRRWRVGRVKRPRLRDDVPLKMLAEFEPSHDWLLEPGDMLYVPPGWGHDGVAVGECLTASIGFRAPQLGELGADLLERLADAARDAWDDAPSAGQPTLFYGDRGATAAARPARVPEALQSFAGRAVRRWLAGPKATERALGESLSEPKRGTAFVAASAAGIQGGVALDRRTRMLYDDHHVFINGASFRAAGDDARLMRALANEHRLGAAQVAALSTEAHALLVDWVEAGWCRAGDSAATP